MSEEKNSDPVKSEDFKDKILVFIKRWWSLMVVALALGIFFVYVKLFHDDRFDALKDSGHYSTSVF